MSSPRMIDAVVRRATLDSDGEKRTKPCVVAVTLVGGNVLFGRIADSDVGFSACRTHLLLRNEGGHIEFIDAHSIAAILVKEPS